MYTYHQSKITSFKRIKWIKFELNKEIVSIAQYPISQTKAHKKTNNNFYQMEVIANNSSPLI